MAPLAGFNARVKINDTLWAVARFEVRELTDGIDMSNSEGRLGNTAGIGEVKRGTRSKSQGLTGATVMLQEASYDPANDPFAAPMDLDEDDYADVKIYPSGLLGAYHHFPALLITELSHSMDIQSTQPVTIQGETDGDFHLSKAP